MRQRVRSGYAAWVVAAFLDHHTTTEPVAAHRGPGRGSNQPAKHINGLRARAEDQRRVHKWRSDQQLASLDSVDKLLIHYGLSLWELEAWAEQQYGNNGYFSSESLSAA